MSGKKRRLARIFGKDARTVIVPIDHGLTLGPIGKLARLESLLPSLVHGGIDAVLMQRGLVTAGVWDATAGCGLIIHLSGNTTFSPNSNAKVLLGSVEDALRLGADAVSVQVNLGTSFDREILRDFGQVARECEAWGVPLLAMMYLNLPSHSQSDPVQDLVHLARVGAEIGADIVKLNCGNLPEAIPLIVESCFVPVVVAGGAAAEDTAGFFASIAGALQKGVAGTCVGRNIFDRANPAAYAQAIRRIVHDSWTVEAALRELDATAG